MPITRPTNRTLASVAGAGTAALLLGTAIHAGITTSREGVTLSPFDDALGGHVKTVCFGDTGIPMRRYTLPECKQLLDTRLAGYALGVKNATPGFDTLTDGQKAGAIDFAYNAGLATWTASSIRNGYARKDFPAACQRFMLYTYTDHGKINCAIAANHCEGIPARRMAERNACLGE